MKINVALSGFVAGMLGLLLSAGVATAQPPERFQYRGGRGFAQVHRAARMIEKNARDVHEEVDAHFRRSPAYRHLHDHSRNIERLAAKVHDITDSREGRRRLRRVVNDLDDEVHHFVEVVEDSKRFRNVPPRAYAHLRQEVNQLHRAILALKRQID